MKYCIIFFAKQGEMVKGTIHCSKEINIAFIRSHINNLHNNLHNKSYFL